MVDVRGRFSGLPHGTTPAAVTSLYKIRYEYHSSIDGINPLY